MKLHMERWKELQGVQVLQGQWTENEAELHDYNVVVMLRGKQSQNPFIPFLENKDWQLRLIILKRKSQENEWDGSIYARHGAEVGSRWWVQTDKKTACFYK